MPNNLEARACLTGRMVLPLLISAILLVIVAWPFYQSLSTLKKPDDNRPLLGLVYGMENFGLLKRFPGQRPIQELLSIWQDWVENLNKSETSLTMILKEIG